MLLAAAAVVFIGYSIEPTVRDLIAGKYHASSSSTAHTSSSDSAKSVSSKAASSKSTSTSSTVSSQSALHGIVLSQSSLSDTQTLDKTAATAKQAGINLAIIPLKSEDGIVAYNSKISEVQGTSIVAQNAPDASLAAQVLTKNGITPAAKISCFKDPLAPLTMRDASVLYSADHSQRWLDASGNRWLNPYNSQAQQYIIDLAKEAVSLGYKQIYLDNLEFPLYDQKAWYGDNLSSKSDALKAFVTEAEKQVQAAGGKLSVITTGAQSIGQGSSDAGQEQGVYTYGSDLFSPNLCPSLLGLNVTVNGSVINKPDLSPGDTVSAIASYLKGQAGTNLDKTTPLIQAYTNTTIGSGNYKQYTSSDISAEISALKAAGITSYILYSQDGSYDFSGITGLK